MPPSRLIPLRQIGISAAGTVYGRPLRRCRSPPSRSVYGMNVIVNDRTEWVQLIVAIAVMLVISGLLLRWTKRQGWW